MKFLKFFLSFIFIYGSFLYSTHQKPNPLLQSAQITWWSTFPLHTTLAYFKYNERNRYALDNAFGNFKKNAPDNSQKIPLGIFDIIPGVKTLPNEFLLETSSERPSGTLEKFEKIIQSHKPSQKKPWYLVLKIESSIKKLRKNLLKTWFDPFKQSSFSYLPHITLGKITKINNSDLFLKIIENANKMLLKEKVNLVFDKNHIILKYPKVFRGAKFQKALLMLRIHRNEPVEQMAFSLVGHLPQIEHEILITEQEPDSLFKKIKLLLQNLIQSLKAYLPQAY